MQWGVSRVALIGYSFGADVLPASYLALPDAARARVAQISMLGLEQTGDWEITVSGWLGGASGDARPVREALMTLPAALVQCFYGEEETDSACPDLDNSAAEIVRTKGGHHFDGDYARLAQTVLSGLERRIAAAAAQPAN